MATTMAMRAVAMAALLVAASSLGGGASASTLAQYNRCGESSSAVPETRPPQLLISNSQEESQEQATEEGTPINVSPASSRVPSRSQEEEEEHEGQAGGIPLEVLVQISSMLPTLPILPNSNTTAEQHQTDAIAQLTHSGRPPNGRGKPGIMSHGIGFGVEVGTKGRVNKVEPSGSALRGVATFLVSPQLLEPWKHPIKTIFHTVMATFLSIIWEAIWVSIYIWFYNRFKPKIFQKMAAIYRSPERGFKIFAMKQLILLCVLILHLWKWGRWIGIVYLASVETGTERSFIMRCKVPIVSEIMVIAWNILGQTICKYVAIKRNGRQRHESSGVELPRDERAPQQL